VLMPQITTGRRPGAIATGEPLVGGGAGGAVIPAKRTG
jgi:hypothetical protein